MKKKWLLAKQVSEDFRNKFPEVESLILQILFNRGIKTQSEIDDFLNPDYNRGVHDPFIFRDMERAVARIFSAVSNNEIITVHGDYDADGVSSTALLVSVLKELGAKVNVYIPHRVTEGYGINKKAVDEILKLGTSLIITVDCGISNRDEIEYAKQRGIEVIVTDHHEEPPELPEAYAIINPHLKREKYPFQELAGVGVAFKLVQALIIRDSGKHFKSGFEKWLLDLVAIGTIGDCVTLMGENRIFAKYGLVVLRKSKRPGIREITSISGHDLNLLGARDVSFGIVPRLNAAGRIDHANTAYELLMSKGTVQASEIAKQLENTNRQRQKVTDEIFRKSKDQLADKQADKILFAIGDGWQLGVVGLVAGKLTEEFSKPAIVMGRNGDEIVGSGRSIPGFDITAALIKSKEYLVKFGGHASACGFSLLSKNYDKFINSMKRIAEREISDELAVPAYFVDCLVGIGDITWKVVEELENLEPFGEGNRMPLFMSRGVEIVNFQPVGADGRHLRLFVKQKEIERKVIAFGFGNSLGKQIRIGDKIDILFNISINEWNGNRELQFKLVDYNLD